MARPFRVVLISPYSHISAIGLRPISACLKLAGWDTRMIFLPDVDEWLSAPRPHRQDYPATVLEQVCELCTDADLVGIGVMSNFVGRARALTEALHTRLSLPVIWGGIHPTVRPAQCMQWADYVCVGEGEEAMLELVNRLAVGQDCSDIRNIWLKDKAGRLVANPVRPLNCSLDDLPLPDYDLSQHYVLHRGQVAPLTPSLLSYYLLNYFAGEPRVAYMIVTSRGCPYDCTYCCENAQGEIYPDWRRLRRRSPEHIIAELLAARTLLPALQTVMFMDSTFLALGPDKLRRFIQMYRPQVGLPFFIMATPGSVTEDNMLCLVEAGLQDVEMGIQTGSPRTRAFYRRPESHTEVLAAARCIARFRQHIPSPRYDVIADNPYETDEDRLETLRLLFQFPRSAEFNFFSLTFYPGTELYQRAAADGMIQDDEQDIYRKCFVKLEPTYYNFVLWCIHRHLPRFLLALLIQPQALKVLGSTALHGAFYLLWKGINAIRVWQARQLYWQLIARLSLDSPSG